jgi:hypothetical protein
MNEELLLAGLDGSNPLAFLAALGTLRTLTLARPGARTALRWQADSAWRPVLYLSPPLTADEVVALLTKRLAAMKGHPSLGLADNLEVTPEAYREYCLRATACPAGDRTWADFAAAFGCEATTTEKNKKTLIQDTAFRTMSGAGHQHFLGFMRNLVAATTPEHLHKALFRPWIYDDPVRNLTVRWDPAEDKRYALQWGEPASDPTRGRTGSVLGANRLAIEGLPLFPSAPVGAILRTTGFTGTRSTDTFWTWPIWGSNLTLDTVRSLLALRDLQHGAPDRRALSRMGVQEVYRSQRFTVGKYRNFAPAQSV